MNPETFGVTLGRDLRERLVATAAERPHSAERGTIVEPQRRKPRINALGSQDIRATLAQLLDVEWGRPGRAAGTDCRADMERKGGRGPVVRCAEDGHPRPVFVDDDL